MGSKTVASMSTMPHAGIIPKIQPSGSAQAFREFASGGHVEADRALALLADQQRGLTYDTTHQQPSHQVQQLPTNQVAIARTYAAAAAQFTNPQHDSLTPLTPLPTNTKQSSWPASGTASFTRDTELLRTHPDGKGGQRSLYRETYNPKAAEATPPSSGAIESERTPAGVGARVDSSSKGKENEKATGAEKEKQKEKENEENLLDLYD